MAWYDNAWSSRFPVVIDHTQVGVDAALDIVITDESADIPAGFWSAVKADGSDIVVTAADGTTKLKRYLAAIDTGAEILQLWTRPTLSSSADVTIYIYYNNPAASETNDADTFDAEFQFPCEEDDPSTDDPVDATGNHADASFEGTWAAGDSVDGQIGQAWNLDVADSQYVRLPDEAGLDMPSAFTVRFWVYFDSVASQVYLVSKSSFGDSKRSWHITWQGSANNEWSAATSTDGSSTTTFYKFAQVLSTGGWYQVTAVYDSSQSAGNRWKFYVDNSSKSATVSSEGSGAPYNNNVPVSIGARVEQGTPDRFHEGRIDMVGVWRRAMSSGERTTRYNNESDPGSFYACGAMESQHNLAAAIDTATSMDAALGITKSLAAAIDTGTSMFADLQVGVIVNLEAAIDTATSMDADLEGGTTFTGGRIRLSAPDGALEIRRVPFDHQRINVAATEVLELVAPQGHPGPVLWCDRNGWLEASVDGGAFQAVGADRASAAALGFFVVGQRKTLELRLTIPPATSIRSDFIRLTIGLGIGA